MGGIPSKSPREDDGELSPGPETSASISRKVSRSESGLRKKPTPEQQGGGTDDPDSCSIQSQSECDSISVDPIEAAHEELSTEVDHNKVRQLKKTYMQQDAVIAPAPARGMKDVAVLELALALRENNSITSVDLANQRIRQLSLLFLFRELSHIYSLTAMDLSHNYVGSGGSDNEELPCDSNVACLALADILKAENVAIETLNLEMNTLSPPDGEILGKALANNSSLRELRLRDNSIADAGAAAIGEALSTSSTMQFLDLNNNGVGPRGARSLSNALRVSSCCLNAIFLDGNSIGGEGCKAIASALGENGSLQVLSLWRNEIGDEGAKHLARALSHNSVLLELNVGDNAIGDNGIAALLQAMDKNSTLSTLSIWYNSIEEAGMKIIASMLKKNICLKSLNVHGMRGLTGRLALVLADGLRNNSVLQSLDIGDNGLSNADKVMFLTLLRKSKVSALKMIYGIVLTDFIDMLDIEYTADLSNTAILAIMQNRKIPKSKTKNDR